MDSERICPKCESTDIRPGNISNIGEVITSQNTYYCKNCGFTSVFFPVIEKKGKKTTTKESKEIIFSSIVKTKPNKYYTIIVTGIYLVFMFLLMLSRAELALFLPLFLFSTFLFIKARKN